MLGYVTLPYGHVYSSVESSSSSSRINFHNPVVVKEFKHTAASGIGGYSYFYAKGNSYKKINVGYGFNVCCMTDRLLNEDLDLNYGGSYNQDGYGWFDLNGFDQQAKGLTSTSSVEKDGQKRD